MSKLPPDCLEPELHALFGRFGDLRNVCLQRDFGFVEFVRLFFFLPFFDDLGSKQVASQASKSIE